MSKHLLIHGLRHWHGCAFRFVVRFAVEDIGRFGIQMLISFDDNQLFAFPVRNIYILDWDVDKRLYFSHLNGYLLTGFVAHDLSLNLQSAWCDTENQDTAVSVEEGTKRMHGVLKFASGLLQFK